MAFRSSGNPRDHHIEQRIEPDHGRDRDHHAVRCCLPDAFGSTRHRQTLVTGNQSDQKPEEHRLKQSDDDIADNQARHHGVEISVGNQIQCAQEINAEPISAATTESTDRQGIRKAIATSRGATRKRNGPIPIASIASTSSETCMVPSSAV